MDIIKDIEKKDKTVNRENIPRRKEASEIICSECGAEITEKVIQYSEAKFGRALCMSCQKKYKRSA